MKEIRRLLRAAAGNARLVGFKRYETGELILYPLDDGFACPKDHLFVIATQRPNIDWSRFLQLKNLTCILRDNHLM